MRNLPCNNNWGSSCQLCNNSACFVIIIGDHPEELIIASNFIQSVSLVDKENLRLKICLVMLKILSKIRFSMLINVTVCL